MVIPNPNRGDGCSSREHKVSIYEKEHKVRVGAN